MKKTVGMALPMIPRDVSWMYFNYRILQEAKNKDVPLLERLGFMGIYSNNLDEFFRVRMATQARIAESSVKQMKTQSEEAGETIKEINRLNNRYNKEFEHVVQQLTEELAKEKICMLTEKQLTEPQQAFIRSYFRNKLAGFTNPIWLSQAERLANERDAEGNLVFTPLIALSLMFFVLIYFPCIATVTAIVKESNSWKWGLFVIGYTCTLAWIVSFAVFQIGSLFV